MTMLPHRPPTASPRPNQKPHAAPPPRSATDTTATSAPLPLPSLGTTAKLSAFSLWGDPETGEIKPPKKAYDPHAAGAERLALQDIVAKLLPNHRTARCERVVSGVKGSGGKVEVRKCLSAGTTFFSGLQTCTSIWTCPVCAAKISERRRIEVLTAMDLHKAAGGVHGLMTLTHRHSRHDVLVDTLARQATALAIFNADGSVKATYREMGIIGAIRALEVTASHRSEANNGWHVHVHTLQFGGIGDGLAPRTAEQMQVWETTLYRRWASACKRAGLGVPDREHGVRLDSGNNAASYVAKMGLEQSKHWNASHEVTKGHLKKSRSGESPWDLLRAVDADATDKQAGRLFVEYAEAFAGRKQLFWSRGLKKRYAMPDLTDAEIAAKKEEKSIVVAVIEREQWRDVLAVGGRATVKRLALFGTEAVMRYLTTIAGRAKPPQGPPQPPHAAISS